jgi:phosphate transport system permease protein
MIRMTVLPFGKSSVISGAMLGLGRALGETMAVAMILATTPLATLNVIGIASPPTIAANIALNYKEATPERQSLLIATGLVLFVVTFLVNFLARWVAGRSQRRLNA